MDTPYPIGPDTHHVVWYLSLLSDIRLCTSATVLLLLAVFHVSLPEHCPSDNGLFDGGDSRLLLPWTSSHAVMSSHCLCGKGVGGALGWGIGVSSFPGEMGLEKTIVTHLRKRYF